LRHARRLVDGRVVITAHDAANRVVHGIVYDEAMERVLEELHGPVADERYGTQRHPGGGDSRLVPAA
jgi:hypothetical protein